MTPTIKIGFLVPYSSISPSMSKDIVDGFYSAIPEPYRARFQFVPEYVDKGSIELVKAALNKLVMFHNVDIVSGIVSYTLIEEIAPMLERQRKLAFFFDSGEYLPPLTSMSKGIFFNSLQTWQLEYALGAWAQRHFSGKGALLMSVYEAGYHMHSAFCQGALVSGAEEIDMHVLPFNPQEPSIEGALMPFFEKIERSGVNYLHALFCGAEAHEFFACYKKMGLHTQIPLVITPHMATEEILCAIEGLNITSFSASGWDYHSAHDKNLQFKNAYQIAIGRKPSEFSVMGYEMGLLFAMLMPVLQRGDRVEIITSVSSAYVDGPRGVRDFNHSINATPPAIDIEKITVKHNRASKLVIDQGTALQYTNSAFMDIHTQCVSGWKNPYLCV